MKNLGFTLAEVLITLGIIGVVAALTAPQLVTNSRNEATCSKLATTVSNLENAFQNAMVQEEATGLKDTQFWGKDANSDAMAGQLGRYMHTAGVSNNRIMTKSGVALSFTKNESDKSADETTIRNNGGALIHELGSVQIFTNPSAATKVGRNQFEFRIGNDGGLYPTGGKDATVFKNKGAATTANGLYDKTGKTDSACASSKTTLACTARIVEEGYKMNY